MSSFIGALVDLLPEHNCLKKSDNPLFRILDLGVGGWFDAHSIQSVYDNLFLMEASGDYLDLHGRDYGVTRQLNEGDDDYRSRIVQEKLEYLTPEYLLDLYGLSLYVYVASFDASDNTLTSDNPYINRYGYMAIADETIQSILNGKFILDGGITWL